MAAAARTQQRFLDGTPKKKKKTKVNLSEQKTKWQRMGSEEEEQSLKRRKKNSSAQVSQDPPTVPDVHHQKRRGDNSVQRDFGPVETVPTRLLLLL